MSHEIGFTRYGPGCVSWDGSGSLRAGRGVLLWAGRECRVSADGEADVFFGDVVIPDGLSFLDDS